jgi:hypothetical protein
MPSTMPTRAFGMLGAGLWLDRDRLSDGSDHEGFTAGAEQFDSDYSEPDQPAPASRPVVTALIL